MALGASSDDLPTVLFYTDNGTGLGHLTRQSAIARRADGRFRPYFLTMSAGYPFPRSFGIPSEYFPSATRLGVQREAWEPLFADRLVEAIDATGATAVVVDHVRPPRVIGDVRSRTPGVAFIWSRRGMWQPDTNGRSLAMANEFDLIVEPGDLAAPIDQGLVANGRNGAIAAGPVVLVDPGEVLPRDAARSQLGLPPTGRAILLSIGDVDPGEIERLTVHARDTIAAHADDDVHLFAPRHPLHGENIAPVEGVLSAPVYPIARFLQAFDGAVSTAGYNSFHEIVASGLPAVFVPHQHARTDDQQRRAEFAELSGRASYSPTMYDPAFGRAIAQMLRPIERTIAERTTLELGSLDGGDEIARIVGEAAASASRSTAGAGDVRSAPVAPGDAHRASVLLAVDHDDADLRALAEWMPDDLVADTVVLVGGADAMPLYLHGITFESVLTADEWQQLGRGIDHATYLEARAARMCARYGARIGDRVSA